MFQQVKLSISLSELDQFVDRLLEAKVLWPTGKYLHGLDMDVDRFRSVLEGGGVQRCTEWRAPCGELGTIVDAVADSYSGSELFPVLKCETHSQGYNTIARWEGDQWLLTLRAPTPGYDRIVPGSQISSVSVSVAPAEVSQLSMQLDLMGALTEDGARLAYFEVPFGELVEVLGAGLEGTCSDPSCVKVPDCVFLIDGGSSEGPNHVARFCGEHGEGLAQAFWRDGAWHLSVLVWS